MTVPVTSKLSTIETAEELIQAVVLADSFDRYFAPLTLHRPRCLLPLAGRPLIEYTLQALFAAGVHEIYVAARSHAELITSYLLEGRYKQSSDEEDCVYVDRADQNNWKNYELANDSRRSSSQRKQRVLINTKIVPIAMNEDCLSVGDALREIDSHGVIRGHFLLVHGDFITNTCLRTLLQVHLTNVHNDKNTLLTMNFKTVSPEHRCRNIMVDDCAIVYDSRTFQLLHYQTFRRLSSSFPLQATLLETYPELDIAYNLIDCEIDICSPAVLSLFSENFDYQDIRRDFVHGVLTSDLLNYTFYSHLLPSQSYAMRASNTQRYDSVSKDLIQRWIFPTVPDANFTESTDYRVKRHCHYLDRHVTLERDTILGENVMIGRNTKIGARTRIKNTIIGQRCVIGHDVILEDAYLWDDTIVEDHCVVKYSLLAEHVVLKHHVKIPRGCILGEYVTVGPNICLSEFTRLVRFRKPIGRRTQFESSAQEIPHLRFDISGFSDEEETDDNQMISPSQDQENDGFEIELVGTQGAGHLYIMGSQDEDEELQESETSDEEEDDAGDHHGKRYGLSPVDWQKMHSIGIMRKEFYSLLGVEADMNFSEDDISCDEAATVATDTTGSIDSDLSVIDEDVVKFNREVSDTLARAIAANHSLKDTILEINGLKFAYDITFRDFFRAAIRPLLVAATTCSPSSSLAQQNLNQAPLISSKLIRAHILSTLSKWSPLLLHFKPTLCDQLEILNEIVVFFSQHVDHRAFFPFVVQVFYQTDVLSDQVIISWYEKQENSLQKPETPSEQLSWIRQVQSFIEWLQTEDSEDENDETNDSGIGNVHKKSS